MSKVSVAEEPLPSTPLRSEPIPTPWRSVWIAGIMTLCQATQFTLYFSSLWPYLQVLDSSATENFYGYIVAAYSLGQISSSLVLGQWSARTKSIVWPVISAITVVFFGNVLYVGAVLLPSYRKWAVLLARYMIGVGGGNMSMMQTYAAGASLAKDRSRAVAVVTGGVSIGMCMGPAVQLVFTPLGYPGVKLFGPVLFNMYTAPAFACLFVNLFGIFILKFVFKEIYQPPAIKRSDGSVIKLPPYDKLMVALCHLTRFTQFFTFTNLEVIGAPLAMAIFAISRAEAVEYFSMSHLAVGGFSVLTYVLFIVIKVDKYVDFRKVCMMGLVGFVAFHLITFSWPFLPGKLITYSEEEYNAYLSGNTTEEPVGCPRDRFSWCDSVTPVNIWVYFVMFSITIGAFWSQINVTLTTIFSNILGPRNQAKQQSMFYSFGSMARLTGPIFMSNLYTSYGPRMAWIIEFITLAVTLTLWLIFYRRLVPLKIPHEDSIKKAPAEEEADDNCSRIEAF